MPHVFSTQVVSQRLVAKEHYEMILANHEAFAEVQPGQFINVAVTQAPGFDPLLRRPFSFYRRLPNGDYSFVYRVVGRGTVLLSQLQPGDTLNIVGPLGNGFRWIEEARKPVLVGGGVGVPPVFFWAQQGLAEPQHARALLGFATADYVFGHEDFAALGVTVDIATDDGSLGHHGFVTDLLAAVIERGEADAVYACGPKPMLAAVARLVRQTGIPAQFAFEEAMGCGVGACLSCVIPIHTADGVQYQRVCKEGPVFKAEEVNFDA